MSIERQFLEAESISQAKDRFEKMAAELGVPQSAQPLAHESSLDYRKRMATRLKEFSPSFRDVRIGNVPESAFSPIESKIFEDAKAHADRRIITPGKLLMTESRDPSGRVTLTPSNDSDPRAWQDQFTQGAVWRGKILDKQT